MPDSAGQEGPDAGQRKRTRSQDDQTIVLSAPVQYRVVEMIPTAPTTVCPVCGYVVSPILSYEPSPMAWVLCILVSLLLFPFFLIGFLIGYCILISDAMQEPKYICPVCGSFLKIRQIIA